MERLVVPDLEETSTITAKGQTTVPKSIRQALGLAYGGKIAFRINEHGVSVHRVDAETDDPVLSGFLDFLGRDMKRRPEAISALSPALVARIAALTKDMDIDPGEEIEGEVAL
jgi:antitoxin PrlF